MEVFKAELRLGTLGLKIPKGAMEETVIIERGIPWYQCLHPEGAEMEVRFLSVVQGSFEGYPYGRCIGVCDVEGSELNYRVYEV